MPAATFPREDHPLVASVRRAEAVNPYLAVQFDPPTGAGWVPWTEITEGDHLQRWLTDLRHSDGEGVLPLDVGGSFLGAGLASAVVGVASTMLAIDRRVPDIAPGQLTIHRNAGQWFDRIALRTARVAVLRDDPAAGHPDAEAVADESALLGWFAERAVACLEPALAGVRAIAPFGLRGLWGAVGDEIASAVVAADPNAADFAGRIVESVAARTPHLTSRPQPMTLDGASGTLDVVVRGTCCLWYKTPAAHRRAEQGHLGYCLSCPLIDDDERVRRAASI
jgi:hypothetical protein